MIKLRFSPDVCTKLKEKSKAMNISVAALIVYLVVKALHHGL